jgi:hypothetical protein
MSKNLDCSDTVAPRAVIVRVNEQLSHCCGNCGHVEAGAGCVDHVHLAVNVGTSAHVGLAIQLGPDDVLKYWRSTDRDSIATLEAGREVSALTTYSRICHTLLIRSVSRRGCPRDVNSEGTCCRCRSWRPLSAGVG